jgi:hypothetical protein
VIFSAPFLPRISTETDEDLTAKEMEILVQISKWELMKREKDQISNNKK